MIRNNLRKENTGLIKEKNKQISLLQDFSETLLFYYGLWLKEESLLYWKFI